MTDMLKNIARKEDGFTLIELLVVILIIGILLAVALPTFLGQQDKAKDTDAKQRINTAYKALKASTVDNSGNFPAAVADKVDAINLNETGTTGGTFAVASGASDSNVVVGGTTNSSATLQAVKGSRTCNATVTTSATSISITCS